MTGASMLLTVSMIGDDVWSAIDVPDMYLISDLFITLCYSDSLGRSSHDD